MIFSSCKKVFVLTRRTSISLGMNSGLLTIVSVVWKCNLLVLMSINLDLPTRVCLCARYQSDREISHQTAFSPKGPCFSLWNDLIDDGRLDSPTGQHLEKYTVQRGDGCLKSRMKQD